MKGKDGKAKGRKDERVLYLPLVLYSFLPFYLIRDYRSYRTLRALRGLSVDDSLREHIDCFAIRRFVTSLLTMEVCTCG